MAKYKETITIPEEDALFYKKLLSMDGKKIYDKYGYKRNDYPFRTSVDFLNSCQMDIRIVICEEGCPYIDLVLFDENGSEVSCGTGDSYDLCSAFSLFGNDEEYCVVIKIAEPVEDCLTKNYVIDIVFPFEHKTKICITVPAGLTQNETNDFFEELRELTEDFSNDGDYNDDEYHQAIETAAKELGFDFDYHKGDCEIEIP